MSEGVRLSLTPNSFASVRLANLWDRGLTEDQIDFMIAAEATNGNYRPLLDALALDRHLGRKTRGVLSAILRGDKKPKSGNKRTFAQIGNDMARLLSVIAAMRDHQISQPKAIILLSEETGENEETLKSAVKRAKRASPETRAIRVGGRIFASWDNDLPTPG